MVCSSRNYKTGEKHDVSFRKRNVERIVLRNNNNCNFAKNQHTFFSLYFAFTSKLNLIISVNSLHYPPKMHSNHILLEEPIRMASILEPSKAVSLCFRPQIPFFFFTCFSLVIHLVFDDSLFLWWRFWCCSRVSSRQWPRSWVRWVLSLDPSKLSLAAWKLGCLVI